MAGAGSTFNIDIVKDLSKTEIIEVPVKTLTEVVSEKIDVSNTDIHFCKIDVEGFEKNVLKSIDFSIIKPWVFIMESVVPGTNIPCYDEWEYILINKGYFFAYEFGINRYYVQGDKEYLADKFKNFDNIDEVYDIFYVSLNTYQESVTFKIGQAIVLPVAMLYKFINKLRFRR